MTEEELSLIEAYLEDRLPEGERLAFAQRLEQDAELQMRLDQVVQSKSLLEQALSMQLKQQMQQMQRPEPNAKIRLETQNRRLISLRWVGIAASILVLFALGWWARPSVKSTYQDVFEPYPLSQSLRGDEGNIEASRWKQAYEDGQYQEAERSLKGLSPDAPEWIEAQLYLANTRLANNRPAEAIDPLEALLEKGSIRYARTAEWYLLLAYWGAGESEKAQNLRQKILAEGSHPYHEKVLLLPDTLR
ncbi:MAG: hypothetical protein AAFQ87_15065 [Bacteroidota bacterium]